MKEREKKVISILIILLLLPYLLTMFLNGKNMQDGAYRNGEWVVVEVDGARKEVLWEEYLLGVVARSIPKEYGLEAMKAQVIISRTYLYLACLESGEQVFHEPYLQLNEIEKKWSGRNSVEVYNQLKKAVLQTREEVLVIDGKEIYLPYHYLSAGITRDGIAVLGSEEYGYLQSVVCPLDRESEEYLHIHEVPYSYLTSVLEGGEEERLLTYADLGIQVIDNSEYVSQITVRDKIYSGEEFAQRLGLESSAFSIQDQQENLKITVTGMGHGLGLSQNTANYMALESKSYEEILQYFYVGSQLEDCGNFIK